MSIARARELRKSMTQWEVRLWGRLRKDQLGVRFRRQHPVGPYIGDFACWPARLIVEADGEHHFHYGQDQRRDAWLGDQGWHVMRYQNRQIQLELDDVCRGIYDVVHERLRARQAPIPPAGYFPLIASLGEEVIAPPWGSCRAATEGVYPHPRFAVLPPLTLRWGTK